MGKVGAKTWFVPDCYYPAVTNGKVYISHEAICVLNTGKEDVITNITLREIDLWEIIIRKKMLI